MNTAKIFVNGRSQAVRLPKDYRFDTDEVIIAKLDEMVVLYPRKRGWDLLRQGVERFTHDFMQKRNQPHKTDPRKHL